ncbi:colicin K immunity protein, partial [Escherichia coli]|nr:colicin K immunity protein [Escherichia coli]
KENTKLKKEPWYLCKLSALFYLLMAIPVGLPSFIYYSLKRK